MQKIRTVVIGFAHMHVNEIVEYLMGQPSFEVVGIADVPAPTPEKTEARYTRAWNLQNNSEKLGLKPYDCYVKMLDELKPDMAFILCENYRKLEVVRECAKRHVNVSIEKPMSVSYKDAAEIAAVAKENGIEAMVNWPVIWRPYVHRQLAALESGIAGKLIKCYYINGHTGPLGKGARHRGVSATAQEMTDEERASTWWYKKETGGGAFLDIGCYGCYYNTLARKDDDYPLAVTAIQGNYTMPFMDAPDNEAAIIEYKDSMGVMEGTWTTPQKVLPVAPIYYCENGVIYCTPDQEVHFMDIYANDQVLTDLPVPEHIANLPDHYAYCKENGKEMLKMTSMDWNLRVMKLLDAEIESAENKKRVEIQW
ncbi:MAG: Gfo/Idh/MocA family oxidoreductase [Clostridiales bacterium]|nr:Gfo/Idh/MocA family oxidoreductase [Clostridiales bacterium]